MEEKDKTLRALAMLASFRPLAGPVSLCHCFGWQSFPAFNPHRN